MKIALDIRISPALVPYLKIEEYEALHWSNFGDTTAPNTEIMEWARSNGYVVFTHDLDFSALLFSTNARDTSSR